MNSLDDEYPSTRRTLKMYAQLYNIIIEIDVTIMSQPVLWVVYSNKCGLLGQRSIPCETNFIM